MRNRTATGARCFFFPRPPLPGAEGLRAVRARLVPWLLRTLYAPKNAAAVDPEVLGATYERAATLDATADAVYLDENDKAVSLPAAARDAAQRERLWTVTQEAVGSPTWAW